MQQDKSGSALKEKEDKSVSNKLSEKVKEVISNEELLNKIIKAISNPILLMMVLPVLLFFWTRYEKALAKEEVKRKKIKASAKLLKKNKKFKKQIKQMSINGSSKTALLYTNNKTSII